MNAKFIKTIDARIAYIKYQFVLNVEVTYKIYMLIKNVVQGTITNTQKK